MGPYRLSVRTIRSGWADLRARLNRLTAARVRVGVLKGRTRRGVSYVAVAAAQELGTSTIPARPFVSPTVRANRSEIRSRLAEISSESIRGEDGRAQLDSLGKWLSGLIRQRVERTEIPPPLQPRTIQRKRSQGVADPAHPLIATGGMVGAISYEVV